MILQNIIIRSFKNYAGIISLLFLMNIGIQSLAQQTNIALNKAISSSALYPGNNAAWGVDGDVNTIFASDVVNPMPWVTIDLGVAFTIGSLELTARMDGDQPNCRASFEVYASNSADFNAATFLAAPGDIPFPVFGTWKANVTAAGQFRYIKIQRTNNAGHFNFSEFRVFSNQNPSIEGENTLNYPIGNNVLTVGKKMIVNKGSGKVMDLTTENAGIEQQSFSFLESQNWIIAAVSGGNYTITNSATGKVLDVPAANYIDGIQIQQYSANGQPNQTWAITDIIGSFYKITNVVSGKCLQINANGSIVLATYNGAENQFWHITDTYVSNPQHSPIDWFSDAKYGVMMHWLPSASQATLNNVFDVNALANQLEDAGAKYLIFTLGQNNGFYNSPNAAYESYTGNINGTKTSTRDLPADLITALSNKGIKLILYLPCQVANQDPQAQSSFGLPTGSFDQPVNTEFALKWAQVIQEWSDRYGSNVAGWWFDGGYLSSNFTNEIFDIYANAAKHGNNNSIVTFNPGIVIQHHAAAEDYTAGETNEPFINVPTSRYVSGTQWHMMTYLGSNWAQRTTRYTANEWIDFLGKVFAQQGVVDIDAGPNYDAAAGPVGTLSENMMIYFRQFKTAFRPTATPVGPAGYTFAVGENGSVPVTGKMNIAYGANGSYEYLYNQTASVGCSTAAFGGNDPAFGIVKSCFTQATTPVGPAGYTFASGEYASVPVTGTMNIAYGANGSYEYLYNQTSTVGCTLAAFGGIDPAVGIVKSCFTQTTTPVGPAGYTFVVGENGSVQVTGTMNIAYGANGSYNYLYNQTSNVGCSTAAFGGKDPAVGIVKSCYVQTTTNTTTTTNPNACINVLSDASQYIVRNDWSDQNSGSGVQNSNGALQITQHQYGESILWVIHTGANFNITAGNQYTIGFDYQDDNSIGLNSLEVAFVTGSSWNAPILEQPSVFTNLGFTNVFKHYTATMTAMNFGSVNIAFKLTWSQQPNSAVNAYVKNIQICSNQSSFRTGQSNNISETAFSMYPNPTSGSTTIQVSGNSLVKIMNTIGNVVLKQESINSDSFLIDLSAQPSGMYIVETIVNGAMTSQKLILQK
jgi:hypothetical protein